MLAGARLEADLPEHFAVLYDYHTGKFDTPLDDRGLADIDGIFELALRTYPDELPSFDGQNIHHVYWPERRWDVLADQYTGKERQTIIDFRDSAPQKMYLPVLLHRWVEVVMIPPPVPSLEVMDRRNAAWRVASILLDGGHRLDEAWENFDKNKNTTRRVLGYLAGLSPVSKRGEQPGERTNRDYWFSQLNSQLTGWKELVSTLEDIPDQDRLVEPYMADVRDLRERTRNKRAMMPQAPALLVAS